MLTGFELSYSITPEACISSMHSIVYHPHKSESISRFLRVYHQASEMHAMRDDMHLRWWYTDLSRMIYQAWGLDKKILIPKNEDFLAREMGFESKNWLSSIRRADTTNNAMLHDVTGERTARGSYRVTNGNSLSTSSGSTENLKCEDGWDLCFLFLISSLLPKFAVGICLLTFFWGDAIIS